MGLAWGDTRHVWRRVTRLAVYGALAPALTLAARASAQPEAQGAIRMTGGAISAARPAERAPEIPPQAPDAGSEVPAGEPSFDAPEASREGGATAPRPLAVGAPERAGAAREIRFSGSRGEAGAGDGALAAEASSDPEKADPEAAAHVPAAGQAAIFTSAPERGGGSAARVPSVSGVLRLGPASSAPVSASSAALAPRTRPAERPDARDGTGGAARFGAPIEGIMKTPAATGGATSDDVSVLPLAPAWREREERRPVDARGPREGAPGASSGRKAGSATRPLIRELSTEGASGESLPGRTTGAGPAGASPIGADAIPVPTARARAISVRRALGRAFRSATAARKAGRALETLFALPLPLVEALPGLAPQDVAATSDDAVGARLLVYGSLGALGVGSLQTIALFAFLEWRRRRRAARGRRVPRRAAAAAAVILLLAALAVPRPAGAGQETAPTVGETMLIGGAEGFGGGDVYAASLGGARHRLIAALGQIRSGVDRDLFCRPASCGEAREPALCAALARLTEAQATACRAAILGRTDAWLAVADPAATPFRVSAVPLAVVSRGVPRTVLALTQREPRGPVIFHAASARQLSDGALVALVAHELGHKVPLAGGSGGFPDDESPIGPFATGAAFLDAVGAALAVYATLHAPPAQAPPVVAAELRGEACALASDPARHLPLGLAIDLEGRVPPVDSLAADARRLERLPRSERDGARVALALALLSSAGARAKAIRDAFVRYLLREPDAEEVTFFLARLAVGTPIEATVASLFSHPDYEAARAAHAPEAFVAAVYRDLAGRAPSAPERARALERLRRTSRATLVSSLFVEDHTTQASLVRGWYREYLNREPAADEIARHSRALASGAGWAGVLAEIVGGREYAMLQSARWKDCRTARAPVSRAGEVADARR